MSAWAEIGDRTWVRRYDEWDLNVGLVVGADGALVIDTRATTEEAEQLREHIRELTDAPITWVVNTHAHFDHVAGNSVFTDATVHLHENAAARGRSSPVRRSRSRRSSTSATVASSCCTSATGTPPATPWSAYRT